MVKSREKGVLGKCKNMPGPHTKQGDSQLQGRSGRSDIAQ